MLAALAAVYLIWSSTYFVIRLVVAHLPPFLAAGMRYLVAGLVMLVIARAQGHTVPDRRAWGPRPLPQRAPQRQHASRSAPCRHGADPVHPRDRDARHRLASALDRSRPMTQLEGLGTGLASIGDAIVGCAELAPLSGQVADLYLVRQYLDAQRG